ncbi:MAG: FAD/NAD(P)-binding oxidoreductase [Gemmatimonadaceae bacterium]
MTPSDAELVSADVLVVGAGPAGIAAAATIAESGRRVVLVDQSPTVGGQIWRHRHGSTPPAAARRWIARLQRSGTEVRCETTVVDLYASAESGLFSAVVERGTSAAVIHAPCVVLATGARERFLPFRGWTLPGVIGVGGAQALLKSGMSFAGKRVVIAGSGPLLLPVAAALVEDGARVQLVAEQADGRAVARFALGLWRRPATLAQAARYRAGFLGAPYRVGQWVTAARGAERLEEVTITDGRRERVLPCDTLCSAYGLVPNIQLARLLGCRVANGAAVVDARQETSVARVYAVGEASGIGGVELALVEGQIGALCAIGRDGEARRLHSDRASLAAIAAAMEQTFAPREELRAIATPDTIVCRCEDVTMGAIRAEWTMRQAKLYTRAGMGPCQGRVCGTALEFLHGWHADTGRTPAEPALVSTILADRSGSARPATPQGSAAHD